MHDQSTQNTLTKRLFLLPASLAVGTVVWFMLGEPESITAAEAKGQDATGQTVLARVDGVAITKDSVEASVASQLLKLQRDRHDLIEKAIETLVRNSLLDAAAAKKDTTREELIEAEVNGKLADVPAEEVDAFYETRKQQIRATKEKVEDQIRRLIRYEAFIKELESAADVEVLTEPFRVEVAATGPQKGPDSAPITIVEFSDFECPFCGRVNPVIAQVRETYGDKVKLVFRQFPLAMHRNARKAGEASLCADEQGKFWEMHDGLFDNQKTLNLEGLKSIAASIADLKVPDFNKCLDSGKYADAVEKDVQDGAKAGVSSTPAFFINGRYLSGAQPFEAFAEIIDDEIKG